MYFFRESRQIQNKQVWSECYKIYHLLSFGVNGVNLNKSSNNKPKTAYLFIFLNSSYNNTGKGKNHLQKSNSSVSTFMTLWKGNKMFHKIFIEESRN